MSDIKITKHNPMLLKIDTDDLKYLKGMKDSFTSYVEGFQYMPQYRSGSWNGKTCMIHRFNNTFPYGLLFSYIKRHRRYYPDNKLIVEPEVKELFNGPKLLPRYDLSLYPRKYQKESINACLRHTKGIIRSATASGKSLVISYVVKTILKSPKTDVENCVIVVPSTSLVEQFYGDMIEYGIPEEIIGRVGGGKKKWGLPITISTWQSLKNNHDKLPYFDAVIVDETHQSKAYQLKKILVKTIRAKYRLGFTGTMHISQLDNWNTKAYLGPVLKDYPSGFLAERGFISKCNVKILHMEYMNENIEGTYDEVKDEVFNNIFRMNIIGNLVQELDHNVLLLVGKVEAEGEVLEDYLKFNTTTNVMFLSGRDKVDVREEWRRKMQNSRNISLIATYGIFQQGINIPNLKYIVLASPFKSKIRVLQSIGRSLRVHADKSDGAFVFDIHDQVKFLGQHGDVRYRFYDSEKFNIDEYLLEEGHEYDVRKYIS